MLLRRVLFVSALWASLARGAFAAECGTPPAKAVNLDLASTRSLRSPDQQRRFISVGPKDLGQVAEIYIQNQKSFQKWQVGSIERDGRVFWSDDSKRLFLRDEYAADDTKIRVFEIIRSKPTEIRGLDSKIRRAILARIPENETTQWLYYPKACFAANDSATIIVFADAPLVKKRESSEGKDFKLKLTVDLVSFQILVEAPEAPTFP
jgi:hypothetical protein